LNYSLFSQLSIILVVVDVYFDYWLVTEYMRILI